MSDLAGLEQRFLRIHQQISMAEEQYGRGQGAVKLLAVSKGQPVEAIEAAYQLGVKDFGENYLQEALEKIELCSAYDICWHYIGALQSKKAKTIAGHFDWVHSLSSLRVAEILNEHRPPHKPLLNICIQVNLSGEASKSGLSEQELDNIIQAVHSLPRLRLCGLMTMPPEMASDEEKLSLYQQLHQVLQSMNAKYHLKMDSLSMGMSNDFNLAIAAGSTIIRVGQALFGPRQPSNRNKS